MELNNVYKLRDMINLGGGQVKGRKKIQKIVYIIQQLIDPFDPPFRFKWNYYGVYSDELAGELGIGEFFGILKETQTIEYGYRTYALEATNSDNPSTIAQDEQMQSLVSFLNGKEPRLLEVLSSIIYFKNEGLSDEKIEDRLQAYKGHLSDFFSGAGETRIELEKMLL